MYVGDFTGTPDVTELNNVEEVQIDFGLRSPFTSSATLDGVADVDGIYIHAPIPTIQLTLTDAELAQLTALLPHTTSVTASSTTSLGFGGGFSKIAPADVPSMFILPTQEESDGVAAAHGIWIPAARIGGFNGINFGRPGDAEIQQFFNVTINPARRLTDQAAAAIPATHSIIWYGPPTSIGLSWALS